MKLLVSQAQPWWVQPWQVRSVSAMLESRSTLRVLELAQIWPTGQVVVLAALGRGRSGSGQTRLRGWRDRCSASRTHRLVEGLVNDDAWIAMLEVAAKFHRYSFNNCLLIARQCPGATRVAGYRAWQELGRQVRQGERAIKILAPCTYRDKVTDETTIRGFRVASVFDVAQTEEDPLPPDAAHCVLVEGDAPAGMWDALAAQVADAGYALERGDCSPANGVTLFGRHLVIIGAGLPCAQAAKTLAHELAHVVMHAPTWTPGGCQGRIEVEAESVAYVVARACGLDSSGYSAPYVASWAGGDVGALRDAAQRVIRHADAILGAMDTSLVVAA